MTNDTLVSTKVNKVEIHKQKRDMETFESIAIILSSHDRKSTELHKDAIKMLKDV